jgi:hypothetical protein
MTYILPTLRTLFFRKAILPRRRSPDAFRSWLSATERLETRAMLAADALSAWQNTAMPADVNADGFVTPIDALRIINELNTGGARQLTAPAISRFSFMAAGDTQPNYLDVNGDGALTASDALAVINQITAAQGEQLRLRVQATDLAGNPIDTINPGQEFEIRGFVKDLRQPEVNDRGVFSVYVDVNYDATKMAVDLDGRTIQYGDEYDGGPRPAGQITATAGLLDDIGATAGITPVGSDELLVFIVPMTATGRGEVEFSLDPKDSQLLEVLVFGSNDEVPANEILLTGDEAVIGFPPTAVADTASVFENSQNTTIDVLANDTVHEQGEEPLQVVAVTQGANGAVTIPQGGADVQYTPAAGFVGSDTFTYTVEDADGNPATATVTVTVTNVNDPPVGMPDTLVVNAGSVDNSLDVLANDTDPDEGDVLTVNSVGTPDNGGTATVAPNGLSIRYTPAVGFVGVETFSYTVRDSLGSTNIATVTVTVNDDNPIARPDMFEGILEDSADNVLNVLENDELNPNAPGTLLIVEAGPGNHGGTVTIPQGATTLLYTPAADFVGAETFTYRIVDGLGGEATATVTVIVANVNDAPVAVDDTFTVVEDSMESPLNVLANDTDADENETLTITAVSAGTEGGTIEIVDGASLIYTPPADFSGQEAFTYTIQDVSGETATATVIVTVTDVNETPIAAADAITVAEDSAATTIDVLANDSDGDPGDVLEITQVSDGSLGGMIELSDGAMTLSYTPAANAFGTETFTYTISDGRGGTATATVTVTISPVNDPPTAVNNLVTVAQNSQDNALNVLANDTFAPDEGETLTIVDVGTPSQGGTVEIAPDNLSLIYTPAAGFLGNETISYTIDDGSGLTDTATVTVTVETPNNAPTAGADTLEVLEDAAATPINVLANDTDPDAGDMLSITAFSAGSRGGTIEIIEDGARLRYTPAANVNGTETFTYTIDDGHGGTATGNVTVTIAAVADPPPAADDTFTFAEDSGQQQLDVLANDRALTNPDGTETLSIVSVAVGDANGEIERSPDGQRVLYTPPPNFVGTETFSYTVTDGVLTTTAMVTVTVMAVEDAPVAGADTFDVQRNSANNTLNVLVNDSDADGDPISITDVSEATNGTVAIAPGGGSLIYTPDADFFGEDEFEYTVTDDTGRSTTETVTVNVIGPMIGSLSGFVYVDADNDGIKDSGERPLAGVSIRLWGGNVLNQPVDITTTTDANGAYRFDDVIAGTYVIEQVQPFEYRDGAESVGTAGGTADPTNGHDQFFLVYGGQNGANYNFAELGLKPEAIGRHNFFVP